MTPRLELRDVAKSFTMHLRDGVHIPVVRDVTLTVSPGECVVLAGPSGVGKSSILKMIYGNYEIGSGMIRLATNGGFVDIAAAPPRTILAARRSTVGYVSQFLRVVPRVATRDIVVEPLLARGIDADEARTRAEEMLGRLNLPSRLWGLPPATFSGGEQQRVNIARGFIDDKPLLLLDEPTASLDAVNRQVVIDLIRSAKTRGVGFLGIFHDEDVRDAVADRLVDVRDFAVATTA
ncbi:phosphonate C-P lyase system protein PhnL [Bauldia sp.]|uniref:phosphonate C-P lyase system protein PhnL n=1 Tax=Bauldia sp. TaxID=2575872 RepID=UPI003BA9251D